MRNKNSLIKNLCKKIKTRYIAIIILLVLILFIIKFISTQNITGMIVKNNSENFNCMKFKENILWSSEYNNKPQGSTNYQIWYPKHNCTEIEVSNCLLKDIEIKTRFLYLGENNETGDGNIQISEPYESICDNPEKGIYLQYLSSEKLKGESISFDKYCGGNKKTNDEEECMIEEQNYKNYAKCYGIKVYGSQYMLIDAVEVKYSLCKEIEE